MFVQPAGHHSSFEYDVQTFQNNSFIPAKLTCTTGGGEGGGGEGNRTAQLVVHVYGATVLHDALTGLTLLGAVRLNRFFPWSQQRFWLDFPQLFQMRV